MRQTSKLSRWAWPADPGGADNMEPSVKSFRPTMVRGVALVAIAAVAVAVVILVGRSLTPQPNHSPLAQVPPAAAMTNLVAQTVATSAAKPAATTADALPGGPKVPERPLPVAYESPSIQWTLADGKDTNVIRRLAHNELEYQRMVEENSRIKRRQLVYRKDTAAAVMERSRLSGEPVKQLTLPGFDGQELQFAIEQADLEPSRQVGTFTGRLVGQPDSLVTLAFKFGREAFTVISPQDRTFLQGHPRESGEIILTSFDPDTYLPLPGGEPIKASK
jgi:hypothetical protein